MSDHLIVIPAFNEASSLGDVVARARRHGAVLVVDDGSSDASAAVASAAGADVLRLQYRRGKGQALQRGFAAAVERGVDRVITLDGDGQHDPDDLPRLLKAAELTPDALVIGGRLGSLRDRSSIGPSRAASESGEDAAPPGRLAALRVAGFFINWITGISVLDTQSGLRVYPIRFIREVWPRCGGFVLETEMLIRAAAGGWGLVEVPIAAVHMQGRISRFRPVRDGVAVGAYLARHIVRRWAREAWAVVVALVRPFTAERRRARHRAHALFAAPHAHNLGAWALATGVFTLGCIAETWQGWWRDPRARRLRLVGTATAATPVLLWLTATQRFRPRGIDAVAGFARRVYSQERLADTASETEAATTRTRPPADYDVLVVGGGPGGATAATLLAQGGLSVALVERASFPRFHVGESLLPANVPLFERLGVLDRIRTRGFIVKYGAAFHDQGSGLEYTFNFREGKPWPAWSFEVPRAEFDQILLDRARAERGVAVLQPACVDDARLDADGVTARVSMDGRSREIRARFLVDASGRDAFAASRFGRRRPMPGLGKVAVFAHFRGARRWPGREEGNIRIFIFDDGWFWWIPFAGDVTSVGCVLHARTVKGREGSLPELFDDMIARCHRVGEALAGAERITQVYTAANFSYRAQPAVGDRFLCVGDAITFVDPIFSTGVYVAMRSAELASAEILKAFREGRFTAARFAGYEKRFHRGTTPFFRFIRHYYDPAFLDTFLQPRNEVILDSVTGVLAGGAYDGISLRVRIALEMFFAVVQMNRWRRRRHGRSVESRWQW